MPSFPPPGGGSSGIPETPSPGNSGDSVLGILPESVRWLVGWLGTWFILSAMADTNSLADLAAALAVSVAIAATFILGPDAAGKLGF